MRRLHVVALMMVAIIALYLGHYYLTGPHPGSMTNVVIEQASASNIHYVHGRIVTVTWRENSLYILVRNPEQGETPKRYRLDNVDESLGFITIHEVFEPSK